MPVISLIYTCVLSGEQLCDPMVCSPSDSFVSVEFSRQDYWSGLPFPTPGDLPDSDRNQVSCISRPGRRILSQLCLPDGQAGELTGIKAQASEEGYTGSARLDLWQEKLPREG